MSTNHNKNEEEIDLGSLFVIIGKGFKNFFNFIGNIFKEIFHFLITILIFLKKNLVKISVAAILGLIAGIFLEINRPTQYVSELLVEPNFRSTKQLYSNISFYNDLVKQKDTTTLKTIFGLEKNTAGALKKFEIEPIIVENDIINSYDNFITEVDTATVSSYKYEKFKASFTDFDYKIHRINVVSEKKDVFRKIGNTIISLVEKSEYFSKSKEILNENLNRTDSIYRQNLSQLDSLRKVYMQVILQESKKVTGGTNIDLGSTSEKAPKELELFETHRKLNYDLKKLAKEKANTYNVINVISNFQQVGQQVKGITKNYAFQLALLGAVLMIGFLLLLHLNKYLDNYKK